MGGWVDFIMENKIDSLFCVFEDKLFENSFQKQEWSKYLKYKSIIIILSALPPVSGLILGLILGQYSDVPMNGFFTIISIILFFINDEELIRKIAPSIMFLVFAIIFPANLFFNFNPESYSASGITLLPILTSLIILRLLPIAFSIAFIISLISQISTIFIQDHSSLAVYDYMFFFIPYMILVFDKRRSELNKRIEFSQKEVIQKSKKLMHETLNRYFGETLSDKICQYFYLNPIHLYFFPYHLPG